MVKIGPLAMAAMGLLEERPRHPYDIAFTMQQRHMDKHIKLSLGTLYHVVEQLQRLGWVRSTDTEREGRRPERTVYTLTDEGRLHFQARLRQLIAEPANEYSSFEAGLAFLHQLPREEAVTLLRRRAVALQEQLNQWRSTHEALCVKGLSRLSLLEVELVQDMRRFHIEWARRIAHEIESGELEWRVGFADPRRDAETPRPPEAEEVPA
jgi:DNA-binding PadR family transcriptional regulator